MSKRKKEDESNEADRPFKKMAALSGDSILDRFGPWGAFVSDVLLCFSRDVVGVILDYCWLAAYLEAPIINLPIHPDGRYFIYFIWLPGIVKFPTQEEEPYRHAINKLNCNGRHGWPLVVPRIIRVAKHQLVLTRLPFYMCPVNQPNASRIGDNDEFDWVPSDELAMPMIEDRMMSKGP